MVTSAFDAGAALCAPFLAGLPVSGLSISVVSGSGAQSTVGSSDPVASRLEELQFQMGEGPTAVVMREGVPVLVPDLGAEAVRQDWPVFGVAAMEAGARALFSFPLVLGLLPVGVVSLYAAAAAAPGPEPVVARALDLARATALPAAALAARSATEDVPRPGAMRVEMRREVHQAAGMLVVQLGCGVTEAMSRLRAQAFLESRPIDAVARDVVSGRLGLEPAG